jgi:hypothetical protein
MDIKADDASDIRIEDIRPGQENWTKEEEAKVRRRVDFRVVPIVFMLYLLCFLDR